jgi:hypothetical protein
MPPTVDDAIPGSDLVRAGLDDLATGHLTVEALLLVQARSRLRELGYDVPDVPVDRSEERMYRLIEREVGPRRAHARYNALRRRLLSFIRAAPLVSRQR